MSAAWNADEDATLRVNKIEYASSFQFIVSGGVVQDFELAFATRALEGMNVGGLASAFLR